ncbi:DUF4199 family protein [Marinoscillum sp.]|uniref:DUF4199 family protein n=1 Tax=Marinoscillum sp. TaxID=2024838 RepID=UPI003BAC4914
MKAVGLVHNFELRAFNAIIMLAGVYLSIHTYKKAKEGRFQFLKGAGVGLLTSLVVAVTFTIFISTYIFLNPQFLAEIKQAEPQGRISNTFSGGRPMAAFPFLVTIGRSISFGYSIIASIH